MQRLMEKVEQPEDWDDKIDALCGEYDLHFTERVAPRRILQLDDDIMAAMEKIQKIEEITRSLPGLDCGSCGSPTCEALAEDIVMGHAKELDCIFKLKEQLQGLAENLVAIANWDNPFEK